MKIEVAQPAVIRADVVSLDPPRVEVVVAPPPAMLEVAIPGIAGAKGDKGDKGDTGASGFPSADAGNVLTIGTDGGIYYAGAPATWGDFVFWPSVEAGSATVSGTSGSVRSHTKSGQTYFRFIPEPYNAALDGFYTTFTGGVLSGLVVTRG